MEQKRKFVMPHSLVIITVGSVKYFSQNGLQALA